MVSPSRLFPDGGCVVMRTGWAPDAHQLIFDVGPLGGPGSGGHGHADLLSVQCAVFGEPCLVDPGTYSYSGDAASRDFFRGTVAHSTVVVDGEPQATPAGAFQWRTRPRARLRQWHSTPEFDLADAEHGAYLHLSGGVTHRRRVLFVKDGGYWIVVDDVEGQGEHQVDLRFQCAQIELDVDPTLWARACGRGGRGLLIRPFANVALKASIHSGEVDPRQGWMSSEYGRQDASPVLVYSTVSRVPLRIMTLLLPTSDPHGAAPSVAPLVGEDSLPVGLVVEHESVHFDGVDAVRLRAVSPAVGRRE
jgi:hypothetical protein